MEATQEIVAQGNECRFRLTFRPLIRFLTLIGLCAGLGAIPLYLVVIMMFRLILGPGHFGKDLPALLTFVIITPPIVCALNFALFGVLAYPVYCRLKSRSYLGEFEIIRRKQ